MPCAYYVNNGCTCVGCSRFVQSTAVAVSGNFLQITIPALTLCNKSKLCVAICQSIPSTATNSMPVQLTDGTNTLNVITPCGNYLYADQLRSRKVLHLTIATDVPLAKLTTMNCLCCTSHTFPVLNSSTASTATVANASVKSTSSASPNKAVSV